MGILGVLTIGDLEVWDPSAQLGQSNKVFNSGNIIAAYVLAKHRIRAKASSFRWTNLEAFLDLPQELFLQVWTHIPKFFILLIGGHADTRMPSSDRPL